MKKPNPEDDRLVRPLIFGLSLILVISCSFSMAHAVTPITPSGLNTTVSAPITLPSGQTQFDITGGTRPGGGANLFHSFGDFNVPNNNIANFLNNCGLPTSNILGRVTGGNVSNIFGTIQTTDFGNANLFLMNPAGFLFGPNATVNVGGMMTFTSADYLRLADGVKFKAVPNAATDALLSISPVAAFGFLGSNPGAITVQGSQFTVAPGTELSLVGGNITIQSGTLQNGTVQPAQLSALGNTHGPGEGQINLVSVASKGEVVRTPTPQGGEDLNVSAFSRLGKVTIDGAGIATGVTLIRGGQLVMNNATIGTPSGYGGQVQYIDTRTVNIAVKGDALLQGSTISTTQGDTTITAKNLTLQSTVIDGVVRGILDPFNPHGTSVSLNASNNLTIDSASGVFINHDVNRIAEANISLNGTRIVMDGSLVTAGDATTPGSVSLDATKSIDVTGTIRTRVYTVDFTNSGNVTLQAPVVRVTGGTIDAGSGAINAGDVTITGTNVSLTHGTTIDAAGRINGDPGRITIRAEKVLVDDSSLNVNQSTFPNGIGRGPGLITIDANHSLNIRNGSTLSANNNLPGLGLTGIQAGTIHLESGHKVLVQDSTVSANAVGGHGGTIVIASPKVKITGSELRTNADEGPGGTINITATHRVVEDAASVISAISATGPNGSVTITAPVRILNGVVEP